MYVFIFLFLGVLGLCCCPGFSEVATRGGGLLLSCDARASHCGGFSCGRTQALGHPGFSNCSSWALEHRLSSCGTGALFPHDMWDLFRSGIEPVPLALAGRFFTTEPPRKT